MKDGLDAKKDAKRDTKSSFCCSVDFNLLLGCDYVYAMKAVVSTLFRVMYFPHDGNIMTIYQLSFVTPDHHVTPSNQTTLNVPHVIMVPSPSLAMCIESRHIFDVQSFVN